MPAVTNLREGSPCLSLTAHWFPQRLESDHHVYWWQWHLWLLHRHCEHPHFFHSALIFIVTIKLFDIQTNNLSNNKTCKSQYFRSWCYFFLHLFWKKKHFLFSQIFFSPRNIVIRIQEALDILHKEVCLLCSVVKPHRHSHKYIHKYRHCGNVLFSVIQVPRAIVNLVELMNIVPLRELHSDKTLGCPTWFVK